MLVAAVHAAHAGSGWIGAGVVLALLLLVAGVPAVCALAGWMPGPDETDMEGS